MADHGRAFKAFLAGCVVVGAIVALVAISGSGDKRTRIRVTGGNTPADSSSSQGIALPNSLQDRGDLAISGLPESYLFAFGGRTEVKGQTVAPGDGAIYDLKSGGWKAVSPPPGLIIGSAISYSDASGTYVLGKECGTPTDSSSEEPCSPGGVVVLKFDTGAHEWSDIGRIAGSSGSSVYAVGANDDYVYAATQPGDSSGVVAFDALDKRSGTWIGLPAPPVPVRQVCFSDNKLLALTYGKTVDGKLVNERATEASTGLRPTGATNIGLLAWDQGSFSWVTAASPLDVSSNIVPEVSCGGKTIVVRAVEDPGVSAPVAVWDQSHPGWTLLLGGPSSRPGDQILVNGTTLSVWSTDGKVSTIDYAGPKTWSPGAGGDPPSNVTAAVAFGSRTLLLTSTDRLRLKIG